MKVNEYERGNGTAEISTRDLKNQDGYGSTEGRNICVIKGEHHLWVIGKEQSMLAFTLTCWQEEKKPPCTAAYGSLLVVASTEAPSLLWSMEDFFHYIIWLHSFFLNRLNFFSLVCANSLCTNAFILKLLCQRNASV